MNFLDRYRKSRKQSRTDSDSAATLPVFFKYGSGKLLLISLIGAIFVVYPNISKLSWELGFLDESRHSAHLLLFFFRYLFFAALIWGLLVYNLNKIQDAPFGQRSVRTLLITVAAYLVFTAVIYAWQGNAYVFKGIIVFQLSVVVILCALAGHVYMMYREQRKKEQEIEQLKMENLQSQYDALTNQINPHFFFNSLNGITALVRKKNDENTLAYVNKLSDVFRYILQSGKKGLVTLGEELDFVQAFSYMMEVRFANKLSFTIDVDRDNMELKIPVLSLLPLIDNIVTHNTIDSDHKMEVDIRLNESCELVVSNPVYPKLTASETNGTGLKNLENRFALLMKKRIRIEEDGEIFTVYLPLK